ncbi:MAG: RHS repeat-associated core domain-containing protein, partial [Bacteroidota bacterium]
DYGFRIYNPALGRFLSVDPLTSEYPYYTPYQFAGNMPIAAIDIDGLEPKIITSPRVFQGKLHTADEINGILQSRYKEIMHDNFIVKDENTGLHKFDHARVSEILNNTVKERGWAAARTQFKEFKANSDAALLKWDSWLFNGQTARANLLREQELEAYFAQRQFEYKLARYKKIAEAGKVSAIVDIALGSTGAIISSISIGTSIKSMGAELPFAIAGLGFSLDQVAGGVEALEAIENGLFDPSKDYKIVRGLVQEVGGDAGGVLYDISSLLVGGRSSIRNVKNISGKKLNDIVKGSDVLVNSVNTGRTTKDYLDKEY